jgi:hypothetical protein
MVRGRPGVAPQTTKREWFARLIAQGVPSAAACRIVGVNPRTGKRWRHGRTITSSSGAAVALSAGDQFAEAGDLVEVLVRPESGA